MTGGWALQIAYRSVLPKTFAWIIGIYIIANLNSYEKNGDETKRAHNYNPRVCRMRHFHMEGRKIYIRWHAILCNVAQIRLPFPHQYIFSSFPWKKPVVLFLLFFCCCQQKIKEDRWLNFTFCILRRFTLKVCFCLIIELNVIANL